MKKFLLAIMTVFLVSCQSAGSGEFEITDQVYFEPLKESDFVIDDNLAENESALDFLKETDNVYRLSIVISVSSSKNNKEQFSVRIDNDEMNKIINKYVYPVTEDLWLSDIRSNKLTGNASSHIDNYILMLNEEQKEEVISQLKETPILIKIVGDESGVKEIAYSLTDFDN